MHRLQRLTAGLGIASILAVGALSSVGGAHAASVASPPTALVAKIPSPYSTAAQAPSTFTGDAAQWAVGIVSGAKEAVVYLCDGKNVGQWFGATISNGSLTGTAPNGSYLKASLKSGAWTGTVTLAGKPTAFSAIASTPANGYGVWRVKPSPFDGPDYVVGWISSAKGIRGIAQTPKGVVANGVVATVNGTGQAVLNGAPLTITTVVIPAVLGEVKKATVVGTPTTVPVTDGFCLAARIAANQAQRAVDKGVADNPEGSNIIALADASVLADQALAACKKT